MGAYETWKEARARLAKDPGSEHLQAVVDYLRPAALEDYLEEFVQTHFSTDYDYDETYISVSSEDVAPFLAGLDELRAPSSKELEQIRRDLHKQVLDATSKLLRMPWTGEARYDEAIADVRSVLSAVIDGKPWPVLDRLRCPSKFHDVRAQKMYRCHLQLPHGDNHIHNAGNKTVTWTDEQSTNPPKPYAEKIDSPDRCTSEHTFERGMLAGNTYQCALISGHKGKHESAGGSKWSNAEPGKPTEAQLDKLAEEVFGKPEERAAELCHERHPSTRQLCIRRPHPDSISHVTTNGRAW